MPYEYIPSDRIDMCHVALSPLKALQVEDEAIAPLCDKDQEAYDAALAYLTQEIRKGHTEGKWAFMRSEVSK